MRLFRDFWLQRCESHNALVKHFRKKHYDKMQPIEKQLYINHHR